MITSHLECHSETVPSMPPCYWMLITVSITQPPLASVLTINPNITMSFSGMFMNYSEHLCGAAWPI